MKDFTLKADIHFKANNLDHAFFLLHQHFWNLYTDPDKDHFDFLGELVIEPEK